jgi:flagellar protein FlaG
VILMKVADLASDVGYKTLPEPARALSIENKGATKSPAATLGEETVSSSDKDRPKEAVKIAEKLSKMANRRLKFEYREEADVFQITVVDDEDEVVRKIPADSILRVIENIERMLGLSIDTKA